MVVYDSCPSHQRNRNSAMTECWNKLYNATFTAPITELVHLRLLKDPAIAVAAYSEKYLPLQPHQITCV